MRASGRRVAVKVLTREAGEQALRDAMQDEVRVLAAHSHPRVAEVFDDGVVDASELSAGLPAGAPYLVMELAPG